MHLLRRVMWLSALSPFLIVSIAAAQQTLPPKARSADELLRAEDLQADVAVLRKAYETLHPGLYRYNSKAEIDRRFESLVARFRRDTSLRDAYLSFSVFAASIKCGHTYPNFFNQEKPVAAALFEGQNRVPFYFRWLGGKMIVTTDFTPDHVLPRGSEILSINGTPAGAVLSRLLKIARADGSNDAKRVAYLEVTGDSNYEAFDIYFPMFFPARGASIELSVRRYPDGRDRTLNVAALTFEQRIAPIKKREESRKSDGQIQFVWKYLPDGSAYLRMPTWALYNSKWDWKKWLNERLDDLAIASPGALIIDLRGNEGGSDVGNEILSRLVQRDLKLASYRRLVRYRQTPAELDPYLDTWDSSFKNWGESATELDRPFPTAPPVHYFSLHKYDDDDGGDMIRAQGKPFHGKVYVLIDANNSSATFQFARIVQENRLGILVGEPTGGNLRGINGGAFFFLRLPKSGIEMDLPLIASFPSSPQPDSGLTPDVMVFPTPQDIAEGRDPEMAKVAELVRVSSASSNSTSAN